MKPETIDSIIRLNNEFYKEAGLWFSATRQSKWIGWDKLLEILRAEFDRKPIEILDVACGNGRFFDFINTSGFNIQKYRGIDSSIPLLEEASLKYSSSQTIFEYLDILSDEIKELGLYNLIVCFGFIHHIPSNQLRINFINKIRNFLKPNGIMILTLWMDGENRPKIVEENYSEKVKKISSDFESNDYILGWDKKQKLERYCHLFNEIEVNNLLGQLDGFDLLSKFYSDGKTNMDNCYLILKKSN